MVLHVALFVAPTHPAEVVVEEVMALEGQKAPGQRALFAHHLGDRDGGVVIGDPQRHRPKNSNPATWAAWKVSVHSRG